MIRLPDHICRKCGKIHSDMEFKEDKFCRECGTYLSDKPARSRTRRYYLKPAPTTRSLQDENLRKARANDYSKQYGISTLYHITPIGNVPSIMQHGLKCHIYAGKDGMLKESCSNPEIQEHRSRIFVGGQSANYYVPLFFSEKPPMLWDIEYNREHHGKAIVYICIKGEIIGEKNVLFSDGNVAATATSIYNELSDLGKLDWESIRVYNPDKLGREEAKRIKSAEVLVPYRIDPSWFQKLIVPDNEAKSQLKTALPYPILIEVNPSFYFTCRGEHPSERD